MALKNPDIDNDTKPLGKKESSVHLRTSMLTTGDISIKQETVDDVSLKQEAADDVSIKQEAADDLKDRRIQNAISSDTSMDEVSDEISIARSTSGHSEESSDEDSGDSSDEDFDDPSDEDYEYSSVEDSDEGSDIVGYVSPGPSKVTAATTKPQKRWRYYNATEKRLFLEGLELYGTEWEKVQMHVGTRDLKSVKSHFSDLIAKGLLLPKKAQTPLKITLDNKRRTDYSLTRLRNRQRKAALNPHDLFYCGSFSGIPGSGDPESQPFKLTVKSNVLLGMDFHAHLMSTEIIGFLAGAWEKESKSIIVLQAFPCKSLETEQNDVNVEIDPVSAIETRDLIRARGMVVVGWYHSHPTFRAYPSLIDTQNQRNYQRLFRDDDKQNTDTPNSNAWMPFVGAIVSPYSRTLDTAVSDINWFYESGSSANSPDPKLLDCDLQESDYMSQDEADRLFSLLELYASSPDKIDFTKKWRPHKAETLYKKMVKSICSRMPWIRKEDAAADDDAFLKMLSVCLKEKWDYQEGDDKSKDH